MRYAKPFTPCAVCAMALTMAIVSGHLGSTAAAQVPEEPTPPSTATPMPQEAVPLEDEKLDQYADAYLDIEQIEREASAELEQAENPAAADAIKKKAEGDIIEAIERSGLRLEEFNQITEIAMLDDSIRLKIADRVEKRRRI